MNIKYSLPDAHRNFSEFKCKFCCTTTIRYKRLQCRSSTESSNQYSSKNLVRHFLFRCALDYAQVMSEIIGKISLLLFLYLSLYPDHHFRVIRNVFTLLSFRYNILTFLSLLLFSFPSSSLSFLSCFVVTLFMPYLFFLF